jgi:hypothetical protein
VHQARLPRLANASPPDANASKKNVRNTSNIFAWRDKQDIQEKKLLICPFFLPEDKRRVLYLHVFFLIGQGSNVSSKHQTQILFSALFRKKDIPFDTQDILEKNGINSEEKILYLNNDNLKLINIPYAHRARFLKKLKEIETMKMMKKAINEKGGLSKLKLKKNENNTKYEEILIPKEEDDIEINDEEQRNTFTQAIFDYQKTHSKFEENDNENELFKTGINNMKLINKPKMQNRYYDDNEKNKQFKEISIETTNNYKDKIEINNNKNELNINKEEEKVLIKKSIGLGEEQIIDNEINKIEVGEYIEKDNKINNHDIITEETFSKPKQFFPLNKPKTLCYNCLHMILQEHCIKKFEKPFCSLHCLEIFERKNVTNCNCCEKRIEIGNSIPSLFKEKTYYCSSECLQKKEPNENNIKNKSQIMEQNFSPSSSETSENIVDILDF